MELILGSTPLGFEYLIQHDNHDLRILVRSDQLEEALGWFEELARPVSRARENIGARSSAWLLLALPIGMLAGSIFSSLIGWLGWFIVDSNFCDLRSDGGYCSGFAARLVLRSLRDRRIGAKIASLQRQKGKSTWSQVRMALPNGLFPIQV